VSDWQTARGAGPARPRKWLVPSDRDHSVWISRHRSGCATTAKARTGARQSASTFNSGTHDVSCVLARWHCGTTNMNERLMENSFIVHRQKVIHSHGPVPRRLRHLWQPCSGDSATACASVRQGNDSCLPALPCRKGVVSDAQRNQSVRFREQQATYCVIQGDMQCRLSQAATQWPRLNDGLHRRRLHTNHAKPSDCDKGHSRLASILAIKPLAFMVISSLPIS